MPPEMYEAYISEDSKHNKLGSFVKLYKKKFKGNIKNAKFFSHDFKHFRSFERFVKKSWMCRTGLIRGLGRGGRGGDGYGS